MRTRYIIIAILMGSAMGSAAQEEPKKEKSLEIYGFVMMDAGYNFNQIHPDWFDVIRTTKLPSFKTSTEPMATHTSVYARPGLA